ITYCLQKCISHDKIIDGLLVAGLFGMLAKTNASISGAECGCQAEIGVACMMSAALIATAFSYSNEAIAQSAEIALEHSLGLTCDPVCGYVQIPCIERCAMYALKAVDAVTLMNLLPYKESKVTFDDILKTMYLTGKDIKKEYRETSISGLAKVIKQ
ncbi:MAG: L-serine ammonia-lyase, iron-sulfur-dependent, subunit alpha, partial [Bacilli bacterium]|nr:L-serine ammonia-lyase, iron-sulfur-dependent, subunit alpha [Bacilli bacterium]